MKPIRTLKDLQERNAAYAAAKNLKAQAKETPAKQPKKRKHLVVEEAELAEPVSIPQEKDPESQGE